MAVGGLPRTSKIGPGKAESKGMAGEDVGPKIALLRVTMRFCYSENFMLTTKHATTHYFKDISDAMYLPTFNQQWRVI